MATRTEAIKRFLEMRARPDLASLYHAGMECQVNVAADGGERIEGTFQNINWVGYSDGITTWKSFRIPHNAKSSPSYDNPDLTFSVDHFDAIGMTGWDWKELKSRWVAFDFDAIMGHSSKHQKKLDTRELSELRERVTQVPWVTLRRSTSGRGLHLYVFIGESPIVSNHTQHAALARAILAKLSCTTGIDLQAKVDVCGGNMWVWARKQAEDGFTIIKQGEPLYDIPDNWRDHCDVVTGERKRVRHAPLSTDESLTRFDELANQKQNITLDQEHRKLLAWMAENDKFFWWDADTHMLVTHTRHLKEAHESLDMRGVFDTNSPATNLNEQNCFAYPMRNGAWSVRRYTLGVEEHASWVQDGKGWTRCFFNREADFQTVAAMFGSLEDEKGNYNFPTSQQLADAFMRLGLQVSIPALLRHRIGRVNTKKSPGKVIVEIPRESTDQPIQGWLDKGKMWLKVFQLNTRTGSSETEVEIGNYDDIIRHIVTDGGQNAGWSIASNGAWINEPMVHVKSALESMGIKDGEVKTIIGSSVLKPWKLVVRPFEPEYPGGRLWNKSAPQLKYKPKMDPNLSFPTWRRILQHVGKGVDAYVHENEWCRTNGVKTGEDYLMCWIASMFQFPFEPLPYLFIYGENQNTGKSMFHESLYTLFSPGFVFAENALTNSGGFTGELEGAILCVIEERNLQDNKNAYNRIKDWVTSPTLSIHHKRCTPYTAPNTSHWVHCCNSRTYCPIFPGDTRITMIHVENAPEQQIPKRTLFSLLDMEAPDFLGALMQLKLPESTERLMLPALLTADKQMAQEANQTRLEAFIREQCYHVPGSTVTLEDFYNKYLEWLEPAERYVWTKAKVSKHMPSQFVKGRSTKGATWCWGNMSFDQNAEPSAPLICVNEYLRIA